MSSELEALLKQWREEDADFDRSHLLVAVNGLDVVPMENRAEVYSLLLLGRSRRDVPSSFKSYAESRGAPCPELDADVGNLLTCIAELEEENQWKELDEADLRSELTGLLHFLCTKMGRTYESSLKSVLGPLLCLPGIGIQDVFSLLYAIVTEFLPRPGGYADAVSEIVRLLVQYHDPEVGFHLDRSHVAIGPHIVSWWQTLFASLFGASSVTPEVLSIWDWQFIHGDVMVSVLLPIVFLVERRRELLSLSGKEEVANFMVSFSADNIHASPKDVVAKARNLLRNTPFCTRRLLKRLLITNDSSQPPLVAPDELKQRFLSVVCLPIDAEELVDTFKSADEETRVRPAHLNFVILDCRAEKSFNYARLPTALHVGNDIGFDPSLLDKMVAKFDNARGSHLCILGTGRELEQELNLLKIIMLHFVQAGFRHVGFAEGGFKACIPFIKAGKIEVVRTAGSPQKEPTPRREAQSEASHEDRIREAKQKAVENFGKATQSVQKGLGWMKSWMTRKGTELDQRTELDANPAVSPGSQQETPANMADKPMPSSHTAKPDAATTEQPSEKQLFTFDDDDDDDFDLITSVNPSSQSSHGAHPAPEASAVVEQQPVTRQNDDAPAAASVPAPETTHAEDGEKHPFDDIFV